ncbi:MAG: tripartite tricarboxylate transporter TctB family protein [Candidatus Omnitrophica bacterium]|nr:tripartite tricarboxylate transporter TctB family protein [Candidatus Omnitrophota bacterium]
MMRTCIFCFLLLLLTAGCAQQSARFPSKSITVVVPWDAGGGTDALARSIANQAGRELGQVVNVLNRSGGAGAIGHSFGAAARPDGYTVTMITYELCTYEPLGRVELSPLNFKPVIQLNEDPAAITVHADSPWKTLKEFTEYARQHPGEVTIGNSGPGAVWHIGALKLEKLAGVRFTHVPHNGAKPAVTQLLGKHLDAVSVSPAEVLQFLELGTLRCLGVMSEHRIPELPDAPTCREAGYDLVHGTWRGLAVPPETPDEIVSILEQGFKKGYDSPDFQETARKALLGLRYRDSQQFKEFLDGELESVTELFSGSDLIIRSGSNVTMVPRFYGVLFLIFAVILAAKAMKKIPSSENEVGEISSSAFKLTLLSFVILLAYAVFMFVLGYILSTILYLAVMFYVLGERRPLAVGAYSVSIVFIVYVVFKSILDVPIPGFWG